MISRAFDSVWRFILSAASQKGINFALHVNTMWLSDDGRIIWGSDKNNDDEHDTMIQVPMMTYRVNVPYGKTDVVNVRYV